METEKNSHIGKVCTSCGYLHGCHKIDCSFINKEKTISPDFIGDNSETMKEGTITPKMNNQTKKQEIPSEKECATLSSKRINWKENDIIPRDINCYREKDVKEFIRKLKECEYSKTMGGNETEHILISFEDLDKLAGEELTK